MAAYEIKFFTATNVQPNRFVVGLRTHKDGEYFQYFQGLFDGEGTTDANKIQRIVATVDAVQQVIRDGVEPLPNPTMAIELAVSPHVIGNRSDPQIETALDGVNLTESYGINPPTLRTIEA